MESRSQADNRDALTNLEANAGVTSLRCLEDRLSCAAGSHVGNVRESNQDRFLLKSWPDDSALLAVVADGLGGYSGGEVASEIVAQTVAQLLDEPLPKDSESRYHRFLDTIWRANERIEQQAASDFRLLRMGSTVAGAVVTSDECLHLFAGDCRLYHFGDGGSSLVYRTADHSVVRILVEQGQITQEEVATHPMRSVVTSCLGGGPTARLSVAPQWDKAQESQPAFRAIHPGDLLLLCSDGLCGSVSDPALLSLARRYFDEPVNLIKSCIQAALDAGGEDNITAIAISVASGR
jgi:protein phosphatase